MEASSSAALTPFLSINSLMQPDDLTESAWFEHAPFAFWLMENIRCANFVELGCHTAFSYFCFCQIIKKLSLSTSCYAVDTWEGDEHSGYYDGSVFQSVAERNLRYGSFSTLMRSSFDEAAEYFPDKSIDLLHIDGRHFYDDAKHDFETWLPKLTDEAIVLFHDTNVRQRDFGVWRLFDEIRERHPSFEFTHGHGLGIVAPGRVPESLKLLFEADQYRTAGIREIYSLLGSHIRRNYYSQKSELDLQLRLQQSQRSELESQERLQQSQRSELEYHERLQQSKNRSLDLERELSEAQSTHASFAERAVGYLQQTILTLSRSTSGRTTPVPWELRAKRFALEAGSKDVSRDFRRIVECPLFDAQWYSGNYPEVYQEKCPELHFLKYGRKYALSAGPYFDTKKYMELLEATEPSLRNPLIHFLQSKGKEEASLSLAKHLLGMT